MARKINIMVIALTALILMASFTIGTANAADKLFNATIERVDIQPDKNGNQYARLIVPEERELNGVKYTTTVAVMAFGTAFERASQLKAGDTLYAVCSGREYRGNMSYTIQAFID